MTRGVFWGVVAALGAVYAAVGVGVSAGAVTVLATCILAGAAVAVVYAYGVVAVRATLRHRMSPGELAAAGIMVTYLGLLFQRGYVLGVAIRYGGLPPELTSPWLVTAIFLMTVGATYLVVAPRPDPPPVGLGGWIALATGIAAAAGLGGFMVAVSLTADGGAF